MERPWKRKTRNQQSITFCREGLSKSAGGRPDKTDRRSHFQFNVEKGNESHESSFSVQQFVPQVVTDSFCTPMQITLSEFCILTSIRQVGVLAL
jgi:hypothetical protein